MSMTVTELKKYLKRGIKLTVRDTFDNDELHGLMLYNKSKKPAVCKQQAGQCAEDRRCVGLSVFVCKEDPTIDNGESKAGWRAGAYKVCLSHLLTEDGDDLLKEKKVSIHEVKTDPISDSRPVGPAKMTTVTWEALAQVAQAAQAGAKKSGQDAVTQLVKLSRRLMTTNEQTKTKLIDSYEKLLSVQDAAIRELMGAEQIAAVTEEIPGEEKEEKPVMGFSPDKPE